MITKLQAKQLKNHLPLESFDLDKVKKKPSFETIIGQPRATKALEFGVNIKQSGYNLYVAGESGIGRTKYVLEYLRKLASQGNTPNDWLYINNFDNPLEPRCLSLPEKQGRKLQEDLRLFIGEVLAIFPAIFEHPTFLQKKNNVEKIFEETYENALIAVEKNANKMGISLVRSDESIEFLPNQDGKILEAQDLEKLDPEIKNNFYRNVNKLEEHLNKTMLALPQWQRELNNNLVKLHQQTITQSLKPLFDELQKKYQGHTGVLLYIAQISKHIPRIIHEHLNETGSNEETDDTLTKRKFLHALYLPNVIVSANQHKSGLPIILESNPTFANLFGQVRSSGDVNNIPEFQQLVSGAFHRANGGFILFDIEKVLQDDATWETLKRILRAGKIKIEPSPHDSNHGLLSGLQPEHIPLKVKVILFGPSETYYQLSELDPDFDELFHILVDFSSDFDTKKQNLLQFSNIIQNKVKEENILPITNSAIKYLAEYACRLAEHQHKLSSHIKQIFDIAIEANFWCNQDNSKEIQPKHIKKALTERQQRHAKLCEQTLEEIISGAMTILSKGKVVGQVNGLSIIQVAESRFGSPMRITATVHPGKSGVVDIEREVELGQAVHSKGILLLSSFLRGRYAKNFPLSISAHIAIEQSYGYIDGDSASLAELCSLLSALIQLPLRQDLAVTGAVSQFGEVQSIGGVNEKIEGFFDLCQSRKLTGTQGVIIPASNQVNLMLSERVIKAVEQEKFHIYTVKTVDEAMQLLSEHKMGSSVNAGTFPKNSLNQKIVDKLKTFADITASYSN